MPCEHIKLPGGQSAIVCGRTVRWGSCVGCRRRTRDYKLCDFPMGGSKTCDAVLCLACATHKEPDTDLCPVHSAMLTPEGRLKL
jgi:hypothetical protein